MPCDGDASSPLAWISFGILIGLLFVVLFAYISEIGGN